MEGNKTLVNNRRKEKKNFQMYVFGNTREIFKFLRKHSNLNPEENLPRPKTESSSEKPRGRSKKFQGLQEKFTKVYVDTK